MTKAFSDEQVADRYDSARALPQESIDIWMDALDKPLSGRTLGTAVDLGCGTGRFSLALFHRLQCPVVAIDVSRPMLERSGRHEGIGLVQACAERLPLQSDTVEFVWMSQVFHHLDDEVSALSEAHRVLRPKGLLAVRNASAETDSKAVWLQFFPEAVQLNINNIPSGDRITRVVSAAGFRMVLKKEVTQLFATSPREYCQKIGRRGLSPLLAISDEAFEAGMRRLRGWAEGQPDSLPINEVLDLFVFEVKKKART